MSKVVRRAAISDGTRGSWRGIDVIVIIAWQWYRSIIDCRFASLPLLRVTLSSLIVVLGVLRSYTMFFGVRVYISSLWPWLCHNIFNVVRIALLFLPLSFSFFTSAYFGCSSLIRCFTVALDVSGCSRCCAVDQCWLLLRYEAVIRVLRDFVICTRSRHESVSRSATPSLAKMKISLQFNHTSEIIRVYIEKFKFM